MKIMDLVAVIEKFAAPELQEEYDNAGLITGMKDWTCTAILCCLDVTVDVVKEARESGCNLIIAHHPIIFRGLKRINGNNCIEQVII